jgi:hypothetical protein
MALQDFDAKCDARIKKEIEKLDKTKVSGYFQVNDSLVAGKKRDMAGFREAYSKSPTRFSSVTYDFNSERGSITSSPKSLKKRKGPGESSKSPEQNSSSPKRGNNRNEISFKIQPQLLQNNLLSGPFDNKVNRTTFVPTRDGSLMSLEEEEEPQPDPVKRLLGSPPKAGIDLKYNLKDKNLLRYPLRKIKSKKLQKDWKAVQPIQVPPLKFENSSDCKFSLKTDSSIDKTAFAANPK